MNWLSSKFNSINHIGSWLNELKNKLQNFDIKPTKPITPDLWEEYFQALELDDDRMIIVILQKILAINPFNQQALFLLTVFYISYSRFHDAIVIAKRGIKHYPSDYRFHHNAGYSYARLGKLRQSIVFLQNALILEPNNQIAKHMLHAAMQHNTQRATQEYAAAIFDDYAEKFEYYLLQLLEYRSHIELARFLHLICDKCIFAQVLDLGCGTGLLGEELKKSFTMQTLIGVDISSKMLDKARQKSIYHELHNIDIEEYLRYNENKYDLITAADVFVYFGDLQIIFKHVWGCLNPQGFFAFTVEKMAKGDFKLTVSGRYQHSLPYIKNLYNKYGFSKMYSKAIDLRKESGNIVAGYLVLLQK